jgi:vacuolar-type H+-ATPase subunit H
MMSEETNDFKPLADADDATSQQPVTAAADYPATGAVAGTAATNNSATGNAADRATDEPAKPAKSSKPSISMSDLPDLRATFDPNAPLDDSSDRSRDEFTTVYDIIDSIEEELDEAKPILFAPSSVRVDRESFTGKLDKLKKMLPVQLERASALMRESERRLESAQTQANAIIASAQSRAADTVREANEQAQFLAGQENVTELARQKARGILDQAQAKADKLTQNADKYCITMMESLQQQVDKIGTGVQAGLNVLYDRQREAGAHLDHLGADDYPEN